jgi:hypothetical protein
MKRWLVVAVCMVSLVRLGAQGNYTVLSPMFPFNQSDFRSYVSDFDLDGIDDVLGFTVSTGSQHRLYGGVGGGFVEWDNAGLPSTSSRFLHSIFDVNKDWFPDVIFSNLMGDSLYVFRNLMGQGFEQCSAHSFPVIWGFPASQVRGVIFVDVNSDGILDALGLKINAGITSVHLAHGSVEQGCVHFESAGALFQLTTGSSEVILRCADVDGDFDNDILLARASSQYASAIPTTYVNNGDGTFSGPVSNGIVNTRLNGFLASGYINGDDLPDFVSGAADCCVSDGMYAYRSTGVPGTFAQQVNAFPIYLDPYYGTPSIVDMNLDGREDVLWTDMTAIGSARLQMHEQSVNGSFFQNAEAYNLHHGLASGGCCPITRGNHARVIDFNGDAKPDVAVNVFRFGTSYTPQSTNKQLLNTLTNNSLRIRLRGCTGTSEGYGARVRVLMDGIWRTRGNTSHTFSLGADPSIYIGLGTATGVDSVIVEWGMGITTSYGPLAAGSTSVLYESIDCQSQGPLVLGCTDEIACNFSFAANSNDGSCIYPEVGTDCALGGQNCGTGEIWISEIQECVAGFVFDANADGCISMIDFVDFLALYGTCGVSPMVLVPGCVDCTPVALFDGDGDGCVTSADLIQMLSIYQVCF